MIAVSPQEAKHSRELIENRKLPFEILHDPGNDLAAKLGLRFEFPDDLREVYLSFGIDVAGTNGTTEWTLPIPARYVIDAEGTIRDARIDPDYTVRPEPDETVSVLEGLAG